MPEPVKPSPLDRDASDPLLLFAAEPEAAAAPKPPAETSPETSPIVDPPVVSPELLAMRRRAEAAEKSLREARRTVAALKREMATLVTAGPNKPPSQRNRTFVATAAVLVLLLVGGTVAWRFTSLTSAPEMAPAPAVAVETLPATPEPPPQPIAMAIPKPTPLPARAARDRDRDDAKVPISREYFGTLTVDAVPDGGEVLINRKSVGNTPARITGLRAGSHLVWIQRAGYHRWSRVVLVPADKVSRVSVALEPDPAVAPRP